MTILPNVELYCDGACLGNPGPGGWAYLLRYRTPEGGLREREAWGSEAQTTNNRMELESVLQGLRALRRTCEVQIHCDSQYVIKGLQSWMADWKRRGWRRADGRPVLNEDLWKALDQQLARHRITAHWVKGHAGHPENERVDALAREAARQQSTSEGTSTVRRTP